MAKLAGIPKQVVDLAKRELQRLEAKSPPQNPIQNSTNGSQNLSPQTELLFPTANSELQEMVEQLQPDELSPKQALDAIYKLKQLL